MSSHLDDAVLGAGQFIAGRPDCVVATVFAGTPSKRSLVTPYDAACGFNSSMEAIESRRFEDYEAMSVLQADSVHLDFLDSQYGERFNFEAAVERLGKLIGDIDPEFVVAPLGLVHPDHVAVRNVVLVAMRGRKMPLWLMEDLPARVQHPESVPEALDALKAHGYELELGFIGTGPLASKMDALWSYRSQMHLPEFENRHELLVGERFWRVSKAVTPEGTK
jgi:LmbE family N-acetylglucosaminyl deacetylase